MVPILADESCGVASLLLYGPHGSGKSLLLQKLAEGWLGNPGAENDRAIESFRRGTNPDFFHIPPGGPSNLILLAQMTPTQTKPKHLENVMPLTDFLRVGPLYSRHKVIWIEDAHRMNLAAINSLLKPLEEPPAYAKIILTTSQISQIPATILSRCLVVNCELPTEEELRTLFPTIDREILELGEGSPGIISKIAASPDFYQGILRLSDRIARAGKFEALALSDEMRRCSEQLEDIEKQGMRLCQARVLELAAVAISKRHPHRPDAVALLIEGHKRILANGNAGLVFDSIAGKIVLNANAGTKR